MDYSVKTGELNTLRSQCLVVGLFSGKKLSPAAEAIDSASAGQLSAVIKKGDIKGEAGDTLLLYQLPGIQADRVLLLGLGEQKELTRANFRKAITAAVGLLNKAQPSEAVLCLTDLEPGNLDLAQRVRDIVLAAEDACYRFDQMKSKAEPPKHPLKRLGLYVSDRRHSAKAQKAADQGKAIANGVSLAKDLGNLPGNVCTPTYLAEEARKIGRSSPKLKVQILDEKQMEKLGMGALLSVSRGSRQPAKLIVMEYNGGKENSKPVVLVGKGLTFDAGGISLKPAEAMDEMKYDMCGGASVLGTVAACAQMDLPLNVVGVVPASENLPDGDANKPGDIVTSMSGQTIEILNTDAEGRLILCDALTYSERFDPAVVIDMATLTGACIIALGSHASGLLANDDGLADEVLAAGQSSGDRAWRLPLWDDYQPQLDSKFADMANIGGRPAGTITAACFLSRFTKKFKWAHLDIAGSAWTSGANKGATGRPVPLLTHFLLKRCRQAD